MYKSTAAVRPLDRDYRFATDVSRLVRAAGGVGTSDSPGSLIRDVATGLACVICGPLMAAVIVAFYLALSIAGVLVCLRAAVRLVGRRSGGAVPALRLQ